MGGRKKGRFTVRLQYAPCLCDRKTEVCDRWMDRRRAIYRAVDEIQAVVARSTIL